ncbi:hypothetical protein ENBRE01_1350 [Enteropsectra breve]|nr:hypothetical protein ENBRE01_1350 [Enteropsectra breve]
MESHAMIRSIRSSIYILALVLLNANAEEAKNDINFTPLDPSFAMLQFPGPGEVSVIRQNMYGESTFSLRKLNLIVSGAYRGWEPVFHGTDLYFGGEGYSIEPEKCSSYRTIPLLVTVYYPDVAEVCTYFFESEGGKRVLKNKERASDPYANAVWKFVKRGTRLNMLNSMPLDLNFVRYEFPQPSEVKVSLSLYTEGSEYNLEYFFIVTGKYRGWEPEVVGENIYFGGEGYSTKPRGGLVDMRVPLTINVLYFDVEEVCIYKFEPKNGKMELKKTERQILYGLSEVQRYDKHKEELKVYNSEELARELQASF